jgi:hypothetical protein
MKALDELLTINRSRVGFHYFPNTLHYGEKDSDQWIPELQALGAGWIIVQSETDRAIPESFLSSLCNAQIEPIVQFTKGLEKRLETTDMRTLLDAYARWGVRTVSFFDRPNSRSAWPASEWAQNGLVERFLDRYIPLASLALECNIVPLFPALEPGGNFWDTAFLSLSLQSLARRNRVDLLDNLVLSVYAWTHNRSLNWGAGGPERWPDARPYFTPPGEEDQMGFRAYEWYMATASTIVNKEVPVILLGAGVPHEPSSKDHKDWPDEIHTEICLAISQLLRNEPAADPEKPSSPLEPIGNSVLAANFWLLTDEMGSPHSADAWYKPDGTLRNIVNELRKKETQNKSIRAEMPPEDSKSIGSGDQAINHYLLLPAYEWGIADWHLDVIRPFVKKYKPTIGFSIDEASLARKVTVIGNNQSFSEEQLENLRVAGCQVERISGDGISIATQLQER